MNLARLDFHLAIDDVSSLLRFHSSVADKFQVHHIAMSEEVTKVQVAKTVDTSSASVSNYSDVVVVGQLDAFCFRKN